MQKVRNSNYELMRIISMLLIILYHIIMHGRVLVNCQNPSLNMIFKFIEIFALVHVNSFVLVTGYFQSKSTFKQSKIWKLINASFFYRMLCILVIALPGIFVLSKTDVLYRITPLETVENWFIKIYILLYLFSPFLNKFINTLDKKTFAKLLAVMTLVFSILPSISGGLFYIDNGYTLTHFIYLYFIGAYLRIYPLKESYLFKQLTTQSYRIILIAIVFICASLNFLLYLATFALANNNFLFDEIVRIINSTNLNYNNPLVLIQSVAYFSIFSTFDFKSKIINTISSLVMGIYMLHDNSLVRHTLYVKLKIDDGVFYSKKYLIYVFVLTILIFVVCGIIEFARQKLFKYIYELEISQKWRKKYYSFIESLKKEKKLN